MSAIIIEHADGSRSRYEGDIDSETGISHIDGKQRIAVDRQLLWERIEYTILLGLRATAQR